MRRLLALRWGAATALIALLAPTAALALSVPLSFDFDDGATGSFGAVEVNEDGLGGLIFRVQVGGDLGPLADLHYFYFNLAGEVGNLRLSTESSPTTAYQLRAGFPVRGGAGSRFDHSVFFGNGAGLRGNGNLAEASFRIFSDDVALSLGQLDVLSRTSAGLESHFAVHVQSTGSGEGSETVGAVIPEPASLTLLTGGLVALALRRRSRLG